jgi:hypothetical protein
LGTRVALIMMKYLTFILITLFFLSCAKIADDREVDWNDLIVNCVPSEYEIKEFSYCDTTINYNPSFICGYINQGKVFLLNETRGHSKYMCTLMRSVTFENGQGNELVFQKTAYAAQYATQWSEPCEDNSDKSMLYCASNEEATAILINDSMRLEFRIMLIVDNRDEDNPQNNRDRLFITIPKTADFGTYYTLVLSYYIKRGNLYESFNPRYIFEEEFELNGKSYQDVTYYIPPENSNQMEIYYNEQWGIIAFRDNKHTLWTLKRFD